MVLVNKVNQKARKTQKTSNLEGWTFKPECLEITQLRVLLLRALRELLLQGPLLRVLRPSLHGCGGCFS